MFVVQMARGELMYVQSGRLLREGSSCEDKLDKPQSRTRKREVLKEPMDSGTCELGRD